jgi:ABC-type bacteriocin/lantibiotic exporter with double-glycine peptidase domain
VIYAIHLRAILFCLPALLVSLTGSIFWLSIPLLLQAIIDHLLAQNPTDTLSILGIAMLVSTLVASGIEIGLNSHIAVLVRSTMAPKETFLRLAAILPRALLMISIIMTYSPQIGAATAVLTAMACGSYYSLNRLINDKRSINYPLLLSFQVPISLIAVVILWHGASLVLAEQLSLGQWIALASLASSVACLLSFTALMLGAQRA